MSRRDEHGRPISWFGGGPGPVQHYATVERDFLTPLLDERALGRVAVYADAIPWKWNREYKPPLNDPQIGIDARARIGLVASRIAPSLLLVFGGDPATQLNTPWPTMQPEACDVIIGDWTGRCLPVWHPNRHWRVPGEKRTYLDRVQAALRAALST